MRRLSARYLLLFVLPATVLYTTFVIYPFVYSFVLSFYEWAGVGPKKFVGLRNFKDILVGPFAHEFRNALFHNIYFFVVNTVLELSLGFFIAVLLTYNIKAKRFFQTMVYLPNVISMVLVGFIWNMMLNPQWGLVNKFLKAVGLGFLAKPWLGDPALAFNTVIAVNIWRHLGFYVLVFLAAIVNIHPDLINAAYIDGASNLQIVRYIIFPLTVPTFQTLLILMFIWSFNVFDIIYALEGVQAGPFRSTDVLGTLFYRTAFGGLGSTRMDFGLGAAIAVLIFLMVVPVSMLYAYTMEKRRRS